MTDLLTENARLRAALEALVAIVEGIDGAMNHGTWRDDKGMRLKDTPQWVTLYVALATPAPDAVQEAARVPEIAALIEAAKAFDAAISTPNSNVGSARVRMSDALRAIAGDKP